MQAGTDDAEDYVVYVAEVSALVDEVETLTASFYVTGGALSRAQVWLDGGQGSVLFTAPDAPERVHGWVALMDARGGVAWEGFTIDVR